MKLKTSERNLSIVLGAKSGNTEALNMLLDEYKDNIYAVTYASLKNKHDAEDATQQTMITIWNSIGTLKNAEAFENWAYRIAYTRSLNIINSRKKREIIVEDDISDILDSDSVDNDLVLPQEYVENNDLRERLLRIIDSLSSVQRETVVLYYFHEKNIEEISEIMNCSQGTVKSRLYLARNAMKDKIVEFEKKHNESFFGVAVGTVPMGKFVADSVKVNMLSPSEAQKLITSVYNKMTATGNALNSVDGVVTLSKTIAKHTLPNAVKIAIASLGVAAIAVGGFFAIKSLINSKPENNSTIDQASVSQIATISPTQTPTEAPTQAPTEPDFSKAYRSYKNVLEQNRSAINAYDWQYVEDESHPVVFADVMGDKTPEMIFVYAVDASNSNDKSLKMKVITYNGSSAVEACTYDMDGYNNRMGGGVFAFQIKGEKNLYTYYRMNGTFNNELYCRWEETGNNQLVSDEIVYYQDSRGLGVELDGRIKGETVSQNEAKRDRDSLVSKADSLLLSSSDDTGKSYPRELGITAENLSMTYDEAIKFLSKFDDKSKSDKTDFSIISGFYRVRKNGMVSSTLKISPDGSFVSDTRGQSGDKYYIAVCRGKIANLKKDDDHKYTFSVTDTKLDNEPDTTGTVSVNGRIVTATYIDDIFNTGSQFTLYTAGIVPTDMDEEDFKNYKWWPLPDYESPLNYRLIFTPDGHIYDESSE